MGILLAKSNNEAKLTLSFQIVQFYWLALSSPFPNTHKHGGHIFVIKSVLSAADLISVHSCVIADIPHPALPIPQTVFVCLFLFSCTSAVWLVETGGGEFCCIVAKGKQEL